MQKFYLIWNDSRHTLGIASIDQQHRSLMDLINLLGKALSNGYRHEDALELMDRIIRFVAEHFSHEEELMKQHGFPGSEQHTAEHEKLLRAAATLMSAITPSDPERAILAAAFLTDCAEFHILQEDQALARYLLDKGLS